MAKNERFVKAVPELARFNASALKLPYKAGMRGRDINLRSWCKGEKNGK
jgi:hypothetical protein